MRTMWDGDKKDDPYRELVPGSVPDTPDEYSPVFWVLYTLILLVTGIVIGTVMG